MGLQDSYRKLSDEVLEKYETPLKHVGVIEISAMMHGYMAFDQDGNILVPFRTWRNTMTAQAAEQLTDLFQFNIPQRWSIAHLYQAILNKEPHIKDIHHQTTLAGYVHWKLTGHKVLGVCEASGMFPIDSKTKDYDKRMMGLFNERLERKSSRGSCKISCLECWRQETPQAFSPTMAQSCWILPDNCKRVSRSVLQRATWARA